MISHSAKPVSCGVAHLIQGLAGRDKMRGGFCYNTDVHLKVKGPKKPSRGTIRKDADLLAGNLRWSYGDEDANPLGQRASRGRGNSTSGCHREGLLLKHRNTVPRRSS